MFVQPSLCHKAVMLERRLADGLYVEAMLLADEARCYFDIGAAGGDAALLDPFDRVLFSCESLKVTTRLMHVIAWLLTQRAVDAGEIPAAAARTAARRLGPRIESDAAALDRLPSRARAIVASTIDLYRRVERLDRAAAPGEAAPSPALALLVRLEQAF